MIYFLLPLATQRILCNVALTVLVCLILPRVFLPVISLECLNHFALATLLKLSQWLLFPTSLLLFISLALLLLVSLRDVVTLTSVSVCTELQSVNRTD